MTKTNPHMKYAVYPGYVTSKNDGDRHWIGATELIRLYGVRIEECEIYEPAPWWPHSYYTWEKERLAGLVELRPRYDGNYATPLSEL
jgi:hypothetical protein